jgi:hypothetical protein
MLFPQTGPDQTSGQYISLNLIHEDKTRHFQKPFQCGTNIISVFPLSAPKLSPILLSSFVFYGMSMLMPESLCKLIKLISPCSRAENFQWEGHRGARDSPFFRTKAQNFLVWVLEMVPLIHKNTWVSRRTSVVSPHEDQTLFPLRGSIWISTSWSSMVPI